MTEKSREQPGQRREPGDEANREHDAFLERVARPLRAPERLDVTFEARVLSAVNAEARAGHGPGRSATATGWWRRPRTVRVSPAGALAWAAAFAGVVLASAWAVQTLGGRGERSLPANMAAGAADTVHLVRFVFLDPSAESVSLVGDFNGWLKGATRLSPAGQPGAWSVSLPLPPGRHEYAFIIEGESGDRWAADPFAALVRDEFDTESSVLVLPGERKNAS